MKCSDFLKFIFTNYTNVTGLILCQPYEFKKYEKLLYDTFVKKINPFFIRSYTRQNSVTYNLSSNNCFNLVVYSDSVLCGTRADFVMLSNKNLIKENSLREVFYPMIICRRFRTLKPFVYCIGNRKFLTEL